MKLLAVFAGLVLTLGAAAPAGAQYFGRNKVQYRTFQFHVLATQHFDIYYYPEEADAAQMVARLAERWYARLQRFFDHDLRGRQPVILYASVNDFRQTNAVEGVIGEGTGGVTEALKRRVVVPMAGTLADTDHVLGHELVHAFQFDLTGADPHMADRGGPAILGYPLWFVEGMAEYVSLGPVDPQTAMWLRDAVVEDRLPTLHDLDDPSKYFPYRWGQALWSYIGARWGDKTIASLLRSAVNPNFDEGGLARQLGTTPDALVADWHASMREAAAVVAEGRPTVTSDARRLIDVTASGAPLNVGPQISPDGRRLAFFSERDPFSIDLFVADAATGQVERRLVRTATDAHFDSLQFLDSAGAWSPDGRTLAVTAVRDGRPEMAFIDASSGGVTREMPLGPLDDAINPAWSPDGGDLVFSGNRGGFTDLFRLRIATGAVDQLTDDAYGDLEPTFTPDGRSVVFVTERFSTDLAGLVPGPLQLAELDLATRQVRLIPAFLEGKHLSPQVSADGKDVTFIAEPDGVSNIYRMALSGGPIVQISAVATGVAGITTTSPALSMARDTGRLAFSVFERGGDDIYLLDPAEVVTTVPPAASVRAAVLPSRTAPGGVVYGLLHDYTDGLTAANRPLPPRRYAGGLSLDQVGQPTVSVGVGAWGPQVGGGMSAFFSDMLGDHVLGLDAEMDGTLQDVGGSVQYLNRRHRWNWGAELDQTPYRVGYLSITLDPAANRYSETLTIDRQINRGATFITSYPFNTDDRLELSAGARHLSFSSEQRTVDYAYDTGDVLDRQDQTTPLGRPLSLLQTGAAVVHDTSFYGGTSPIYGSRDRVEIDQTAGTLRYTAVLADLREYFMPKPPVTFAFRLLHYGRYGRDADDPLLLPLFLGYADLVHGYGYSSFTAAECGAAAGSCPPLDKLFGSRALIANAEVRAPLVGLLHGGELSYGPVPVEVAAFFDAGVAWSSSTPLALSGAANRLVRSVGGAVRVNAFGLLIVEVSAAHPLDRPQKGIRWQIGIREGF